MSSTQPTTAHSTTS